MNLNQLIDRVLEQSEFRDNIYFKALNEKNFRKEDFVETQKQFYFAVIFFSRAMSALAAKLPTLDMRLEVVRNVWEEHGEGTIKQSHGESFQEFLKRIHNVTLKDVHQAKLWPEMRTFNTALIGATVLDDYLVGVSCMGIIERMFVEISNWIGKGITENGWLTEDQMIHYNLHETLDIKHSQDFFDILEKPWQQSIENKYLIEQGLMLGASIFNQLYTSLYQQRKRRWNREDYQSEY